MTFYDVLAQVRELLQRQGRVSYRALKRQFNLDDEYLEDLKAELIEAQRLATDEDGRVLVWTGAARAAAPNDPPTSATRPIAYTPRHLAERILAEQAALEARGAPDGERWWEAELHRLTGELLVRRSDGGGERRSEPEACFQRALAVARGQEAKSLELRAAMSLARLWQQQGRGAEARELLTPIYGWFTEGLDTADLQDARDLLDALA